MCGERVGSKHQQLLQDRWQARLCVRSRPIQQACHTEDSIDLTFALHSLRSLLDLFYSALCLLSVPSLLFDCSLLVCDFPLYASISVLWLGVASLSALLHLHSRSSSFTASSTPPPRLCVGPLPL